MCRTDGTPLPKSAAPRLRLLALLAASLWAWTLQAQPAHTPTDTATALPTDTATLGVVPDDVYDHPLYEPLQRPELFYDEDSLAQALRIERMRRRAWLTEDETFDPDSDPYFARFNPSPTRAVWYAALFPGGGQIYNRKYWKLPIIYGGFLGLLYGYQWNARYYRTYSNAYRDLVLQSPNASYMDFLPPNYPVEARRDYLERVFKRKKNAYRNYRDYCVVGMLAVYLVSMVDAYVDASLYHFDVSPELGPDDKPTLMLGYTLEF